MSVAAVSILGLGATGFYQGYASIARPPSLIKTASAASTASAAPSAGTIAMAISTTSPVDDPAPVRARASWRPASRLMAPADPSDDLNAAQRNQSLKTDVAYNTGATGQEPSDTGATAASPPMDQVQ